MPVTTIRLANSSDIAGVVSLYSALHTALEQGTIQAGFGWKRGEYPTQRIAENALQAGNLYVLQIDQSLAGTMIVDSKQDESYLSVPWNAPNLPKDKVLVIHTLAVHPSFRGRGLGRALVEFVKELAQNQGAEAIRLDTWSGNSITNQLYCSCGFALLSSGELSHPHLKGVLSNFYEYLV